MSSLSVSLLTESLVHLSGSHGMSKMTHEAAGNSGPYESPQALCHATHTARQSCNTGAFFPLLLRRHQQRRPRSNETRLPVLPRPSFQVQATEKDVFDWKQPLWPAHWLSVVLLTRPAFSCPDAASRRRPTTS